MTEEQQESGGRMLLEKLWENQQIRSFTAWCNTHLLKVGTKIESIQNDFQDGKQLMKLVEVISGETLPKPEKGKLKLHKIQNLNFALEAIAKRKVRLIGVSSEEIYDCNLKLILGMIWILILKFQIQDISVEEMSARDGLLLWCKRKTEGYKDVKVTNFHTSFQDGKAFCALIHRHRPDLLDYHALTNNKRDNLNLAFKVAEEHLQIPAMLDADELLESSRPDERSVMTYVAAYYHAFAGSQKAELAAKRLDAVLALSQEIEGLINEYETRTVDLLDWIAQNTQIMQDKTLFSSVDELSASFKAFGTFQSFEKPPKSKEKLDLESHYSNLQTKLRINNRPAYHPVEGKLVSDIHSAWSGLKTAEAGRSAFLNEEEARLQRLERIAKRFCTKITIHNKWASNKTVSEDYGHDIASVMSLIKQHEAFHNDVESHKSRIQAIADILEELRAGNYCNIAEFETKLGQVQESFSSLENSVAMRKGKLDEALAHQNILDEMRLDFAKRAIDFSTWVEIVQEDLLEDTTTSNMKELNDIKTGLEDIKRKVAAKVGDFDDVMAEAKKLEEAGVTENNFTSLNVASITAEWDDVYTLINQRKEAIVTEETRQQEREALRIRFAEPANKVGEAIHSLIAEMTTSSSASLEEQLQATKDFGVRAQAIKPELDAVAEIDGEVQGAHVFNNTHAKFTMSELSSMYEQILGTVSKNTSSIENQISLRDKSGVSEDKLREFKDTFKHFDKNQSGNLDRNEFRSALLASGYDVPSDGAEFDQFYLSVDPGQSGSVSLEAFIDVMTMGKDDSNSIDQFLESFKMIAGDKDYVTVDEIRRELPPASAEYAIRLMEPYPGVEGGLDYGALASKIYA